MSGSVNKVILVGNLGKDPEIRSTQDGREIASFSLATSQSWKDNATGERKEKTEWHRVVVFNEGLVGIVKQYVKKGSKLYLEGQLQTRKWTDKDGAEKYSTEVVLQGFGATLTMLDSKGSDDSQPRQRQTTPAPASSLLDDEIPFEEYPQGYGLSPSALISESVAERHDIGGEPLVYWTLNHWCCGAMTGGVSRSVEMRSLVECRLLCGFRHLSPRCGEPTSQRAAPRTPDEYPEGCRESAGVTRVVNALDYHGEEPATGPMTGGTCPTTVCKRVRLASAAPALLTALGKIVDASKRMGCPSQ